MVGLEMLQEPADGGRVLAARQGDVNDALVIKERFQATATKKRDKR